MRVEETLVQTIACQLSSTLMQLLLSFDEDMRVEKTLIRKVLSHGAIFLATGNATLLLRDVKFVTNVWYDENISANFDGIFYLPILHLSSVEEHCKLQAKIASFDMA